MKRRGAWRHERDRDPYYRAAKEQGFRSRAVYKLKEVDDRDSILRRGATIVDLGASPGGWSEFARGRVGPAGRVVALDLLPMDPIDGVEFLQGDFHDPDVLEALLGLLDDAPVNVVLSDMAPNLSGVKASDQARWLALAELALDLVERILAPGGDFLVKVFHGEGFDGFVRGLRPGFRTVQVRKPAASKDRSAETYVLARGRVV